MAPLVLGVVDGVVLGVGVVVVVVVVVVAAVVLLSAVVGTGVGRGVVVVVVVVVVLLVVGVVGVVVVVVVVVLERVVRGPSMGQTQVGGRGGSSPHSEIGRQSGHSRTFSIGSCSSLKTAYSETSFKTNEQYKQAESSHSRFGGVPVAHDEVLAYARVAREPPVQLVNVARTRQLIGDDQHAAEVGQLRRTKGISMDRSNSIIGDFQVTRAAYEGKRFGGNIADDVVVNRYALCNKA